MAPRMAVVLDHTRVKEEENLVWKSLLLLVMVALLLGLSPVFLVTYANWGRFWSIITRLCS
jgi:hypothetical protein